jgi:hypothetical protein
MAVIVLICYYCEIKGHINIEERIRGREIGYGYDKRLDGGWRIRRA